MDLLRKIIEPSLELALADIGVKGDFWKKALGVSREKEQGDLSLPCFAFAKQLGRSPADIATDLAASITGEFDVVATGGYLNFKAQSNWLANKVMEIAIKYFMETETKDLMHVYANLVNLVGEAKIIFFSNDTKNGSLLKFWNLQNSFRIERTFQKLK